MSIAGRDRATPRRPRAARAATAGASKIAASPPPSPLVTPEQLDAIGRERVPLTGMLGIVVESVEHGAVTLRIPYDERFVRPGGTLAGPVLMAAADYAVWGVVMSVLGPLEMAVTASLSISFLRRPAPADVVVRGRLLKSGRRLAVGEARLHSAPDDVLVAHATCTYSIPPRR